MSMKTFIADAAAGKESNPYQMVILLGMIGLFFYFVLWRPEQKRKKKMQELRSSLKKGDRVVAMGMLATVDEVKEKTVILRHVDGAKIEMLTGAIAEIQNPAEAKEPATQPTT